MLPSTSVHFGVIPIEKLVTHKSSTTKEKQAILFWHNWIANQLTFSPFLINGIFAML